MRQRHVPERSCVVCNTKMAKRDLVRVVLAAAGECVVDETGKLAGRGAYLCHQPACWERAMKGGRLAHALRGDVTPEDKARLTEFSATLIA
jgi:predicted RNA-binding protein YlxR (DUF448 family)